MLEFFWSAHNTGRIFKPFSIEHLLGVCFVLLLVCTLFAFQTFFKKHDQIVRFIVAGIMLGQQSALYLWYATSGSFSLKESLPLYTCRIAILLSIIAMIKPKQWMVDIIYFWGVVGGFIALITPDTSTFAFPQFMFVQYFIGHGMLLFSVFYMLVIKEYSITMQSLKRIFKITILYSVVIMPINWILGSNYSYLNGKPTTSTMLDVLPAYPIYVPIIILAMLGLFVVAYYIYCLCHAKYGNKYRNEYNNMESFVEE